MRLFLLPLCMVGLSVLLPAQLSMAPSHAPTLTPSSATNATGIVVRINGVPKTATDLNEMKQRVFPYFQLHGGEVPRGAEEQIRAKAMQELVLEELLHQEATRRGFRVNELEFKKRMAEVRNEFPTRDAYQKAVAGRFGSEQQLERRLRRALLTQKLWKLEVIRKAGVSDETINEFYRANKSKFLRPEAVSLQSISVNLPKNPSAADVAKAKQRIDQILPRVKDAKDYESFGVLAEAVSEDNWRVMMGDHKWVHRGTFDKIYEEQIFAMKVGETSGIVQSSQGFHIFRVNGRQPQKQLTLSESRAQIRSQLEKQKLAKTAEQFEKSLRKDAAIEFGS